MINILKACAKKISSLCLLTGLFGFLVSCGDPFVELNQEERYVAERFNIVAEDIRDFPVKGKSLEHYFYVFKNVPTLQDAKILIFGEQHTNSASQLWTAGAINKLIGKDDVVLFEGAQAGHPTGNVAFTLTRRIFTARQYELRKSEAKYKPDSNSKILISFLPQLIKTRNFLAWDILRLRENEGYYWDLEENDSQHWDSAERNMAMVKTIEHFSSSSNKVFVVAGAGHVPHFEFACAMYLLKRTGDLSKFLAFPGASTTRINDAFYAYFAGTQFAETKSIFDFLKGKDFAVLIPKNLPLASALESHWPTNAE